MSLKFEITRADGRSNAQVIIELVAGVTPGHAFTYADIAGALEVGANRTYTKEAVRSVVVGARRRMLKELQRALTNVRLKGYRVAHAAEHRGLAVGHTHKAEDQLERAHALLTQVRFNELGKNERAAHEGTLMLVGALYLNQRAMDHRLQAVETALRDLRAKG